MNRQARRRATVRSSRYSGLAVSMMPTRPEWMVSYRSLRRLPSRPRCRDSDPINAKHAGLADGNVNVTRPTRTICFHQHRSARRGGQRPREGEQHAGISYPGVMRRSLILGTSRSWASRPALWGFLGIAERGPVTPTLLTSFGDYQRAFGSYVKDPDGTDHYLAYAVEGFFQNGGQRCFVQRVAHVDIAAAGNSAVAATAAVGRMNITAAGPGTWGNRIAYQVSNAGLADATLFKLTLFYWTGTPPRTSPIPRQPKRFDNLSSTSTASTFYESEINNVSNLITVKQAAAGQARQHRRRRNACEGIRWAEQNQLVGGTSGLAVATPLTEAGTLILTAGAAK